MMTFIEKNPPDVQLSKIEHALNSPLRLRLLGVLLDNKDFTLTLDEAMFQTASTAQDIICCLKPFVSWGILSELKDGPIWRLRPDIPSPIRTTLEHAIAQKSDLLDRERYVRQELLTGMIGVDPKMQLVAESVRQVARIDVPVFISGESGTGKELVARAIHMYSPRRDLFFGDQNCATLGEDLFDSHIFGHARGAFTGAVEKRVGLVERCHGGTLFLDEIAELSPGNQVKLLRVLQNKTFKRIGETTSRVSDFRLVSATNQDLKSLVADKYFREDLYYRINVFPICIPALRERLIDLPYLVKDILISNSSRIPDMGQNKKVTPAVFERLRQHRWPGNIRELQNVVLRAAIMSGKDPIDVHHLPELEAEAQPPVNIPEKELLSLSTVERNHIVTVMKTVNGNITAAAKILKISRTTLYKKIKEHKLDLLRIVHDFGGEDISSDNVGKTVLRSS